MCHDTERRSGKEGFSVVRELMSFLMIKLWLCASIGYA